jgi:nitroimidazol reductase NimA-like FMN-containing flavoprotein (pyridoxamine 5'-phosphate oxidase superfamily)
VSIVDLDAAECHRLLASGSVGRVGVTIDALPAVLPVNYVMHDGAVVFRTVAGTKLDAATANAVVAFEVDSGGDRPDDAWSVLVRGIARELDEPTLLRVARALPLDSWAFDGEADHYVRVEPTLITGRRVQRDALDTRDP